MAFHSQDMPTFDHYAFNLRDGLRKAAVTSLTELEDSINNIGYGWLDGYMESIMDRQNNAPITDYMKTPSRTQTVKKTRATTAAAKDKTDKVKGLNARLALSPSTKQNTRMALSPLRPRSLNVSTLSPTPIASPKASPIKSKQPEKAKPKPKAKKGKSKKAISENNENSPPTTASSVEVSLESGNLSSEKSKSSRSTKDNSETKSKSSRSKSKKEKEKVEEPVEQPIEVDMETGPEIQEEEPIQVEEEPVQIDEDPTETHPETATSPVDADSASAKALPLVDVNDGAVSTSHPEEQQVEAVEEAEQSEVMEGPRPDEQEKEDAQAEAIVAAPTSPVGVTSAPHVHEEPERKVDPTMPLSFAMPAVTSSTSQPVRQVRSSWLSKALGSNAVPVNGLPSTDTSSALRKSYAASHQRQSTTLDFTGLRKSLAPINGLKRKSDHGVEEDEEEKVESTEKRPEKTAKVVIEMPTQDYTDAFPTRTPGPMTRPNMPTKTPSFGSAGILSQPNSLNRSIAPSTQPDQTQSEIHKVTKALDELREKTAAKELAKQKAALAASTGPTRVPQAKSTGTGFLRGLGNIGAGLLGLGGPDPEEEAQRLAEELEQERLAEARLEQLMKEATQPEATEKEDDQKEGEKDMDVDEQPEPATRSQIPRSTTPELPSPKQNIHAPLSPEEEEEMYEEQTIVDELIPVDSRISIAPAQRQASAPIEVEAQSTTPTGTPTRPVAKTQAPALHDREEKHVHEASIGVQKQMERLAEAGNREEDNIRNNFAKADHRDTKRIRKASADQDEEMLNGEEDDAEEDELSEEEEPVEVQKPSRAPSVTGFKTHRKIPSSSTTPPTPLNMSTSSVLATGNILGQAQSMAAKALGVKPATGPVKSVQLAAAAAKKEQAAAERKAAAKESEARRQLAAKNKAEEDRVRAEEERKAKVAELEEKRRARVEMEKRIKERNDKAALVAREKAEKERAEKEAQAAKLRAAEEEAARKRKIAAQTAALNKSQNKAGLKQTAGPSSLQSSQTKGKEPFRPGKQATLGSSAVNPTSGKMGPSSFRTAESSTTHQTHSSTITLVSQNQVQNGERKALGPPSRHSTMSQQPQAMRQSTAVPSHPLSHANLLQQSRVALQTQLDEKAAMIQSEDIVLPDIASEYSDSDDEDRTKDFIPPNWAESPQLRAALEAQAHRNPDELFGPIKPLNMEELFKARVGKFRARTSSANWSKTGDGLTKAEEVEYAKRMGFRPMPSNLGGGSGSGGGGGF